MKMKRLPRWRARARGIRSRVLAIVVIPSAVLLILGVGGAGYLVHQANSAKSWAVEIQSAIAPAIQFIGQVEEERRLTLLRMGGDTKDSAGLDQQRQQVDIALANLNEVGNTLLALNPNAVQGAAAQFRAILGQVPGFRQKIDARQLPPQAVYTFYNDLVEVIGVGLQGVAQSAPDPTTAAQESTATDLFDALDAMSRSNALAAGDVARGGPSEADLQEFRNQVGTYHTELQQLAPRLTASEQAQYGKLLASPAWRQLTAMENAVVDRGAKSASGSDGRPLPLSIQDWQNDALQVTSALVTLWSDHHHFAEDSAAASGQQTFRNSLFAGAGVLIITIIALLVAIRLSNRLVRRLKRLRAETLEMADERLPEIVGRLRAGESIDLDTEIPPLDHGQDEIGEVADAFNKAQQTAVAAAVQEARTREGMNSVFLNIAHRSQVVVRRQLEVLDEAESKQEDPVHMELLFKLDHLTTRARRNAENLVILGGERPGRRWRNPVPLDEIARSAVSETQDYARVGTVRLPDVSMEGGVVADLIHLLAELVDNATSFSPPDSRVEVRGNMVGRGVVVEVEDQGLGVSPEQRDRLNTLLHDPPDFQLMALSGQMRLGLFVVAQLAARHNITVTLVNSDYGGIRAIVLLPSVLIAGDRPVTEDTDRSGDPADGVRLPRQRRNQAASTESAGEFVSEVRWPVEDERPADNRSGAVQVQPTTGWPGQPSTPREAAAPATRVPRSTPDAQPAVTTGQHRRVRDNRDTARASRDDRAPLPRRRRQANLVPQLAAEMNPSDTVTMGRVEPERPAEPARAPEHARDTMAALIRGTRQGRQQQPKHGL
jgi:signal transduction histidine kinase